MRDLEPLWQDGDRLVVDHTPTTHPRQIWIYTYDFADSRVDLQRDAVCDSACLSAMVRDLNQHANVWLLYTDPAGDLQKRLQQALLNSGMLPCRRIDFRQQQALVLTHLARSEADCA